MFDLTSFVLRFGVEREELEPDLDGGLSLLPDLRLLLLDPGFSPFRSPFSPMSLSRDSSDEWSPLARGGEGVP